MTVVLGLLLDVVVQRASVQDRDSTRGLLRDAGRRFPSIRKIFACGGPGIARRSQPVYRFAGNTCFATA